MNLNIFDRLWKRYTMRFDETLIPLFWVLMGATVGISVFFVLLCIESFTKMTFPISLYAASLGAGFGFGVLMEIWFWWEVLQHFHMAEMGTREHFYELDKEHNVVQHGRKLWTYPTARVSKFLAVPVVNDKYFDLKVTINMQNTAFTVTIRHSVKDLGMPDNETFQTFHIPEIHKLVPPNQGNGNMRRLDTFLRELFKEATLKSKEVQRAIELAKTQTSRERAQALTNALYHVNYKPPFSNITSWRISGLDI